uniref:Ubiquitin-conjugating enzyme E2 Z n=1 Tax=Alexandrium monilatum TaxID=311494 RepID=A0A7S4SU90_9DINO
MQQQEGENGEVTALIVGPEGTPYEYGFYLFDIQIPDNYPLQPPHVDFKTGDGRVRFNPNLYVEGKVCLSILGTWSGPSWTTSCSLRTVLVSIQSLLNEHPIQNEPGHEKENGRDDKVYSEIIRYENIAVGVVRMLKRTPPKFEPFRPHMRRIFLQNVGAYLRTLEAYEGRDGTSVRSPIWNFAVRYRTKDLAAEVRELRVELEREAAAAGDPPLPEPPAAVASSASASGAPGSSARRREAPPLAAAAEKRPRVA